MTSKEIIKDLLRKNGEIDNHYCINNYLTTRLGAIIHKLKSEGWDFETHFNKDTKNCNYVVIKQPQRVIHSLPSPIQNDNGQQELMHIPDYEEEKPQKTPYLMGF